ncbi:MAG: hypothetical protein GWN18_05545, partial [Thermoplasmata archaeon]|nr:hypothetical protein [Thermoplasmata archaeon]NIS11516.1 hypothetical protein [Thermoplasmata archaeon]NIV78203.1 hypothetical protein [Thermoplasmata archaeon]NIW82037.1 hypothetical protein [Thermoplasmata archaeon]NIW88230.1 hypothetical protein [Thermoplasmata archaeon]
AENQTVEVNISDGEAWSVYSIDVYPEESNEPPEIEFPPAFEFRVSLDAHGELDLWDYVRDLESEDEELVWAVKEFPDELVVVVHDGHVLQVIPVAIQAGEHMVELTCTDPDDNVVYHNLTVRLVEELRHPPVILRGDDALPGIIRVTVGGKEEVNLALQKYWYDQEDFNQPQLLRWEAESLRPNLFSVDLDSNHKL